MDLQSLNTRGTANAGVMIGSISLAGIAASAIGAAWKLVAVASDPKEIVALYEATRNHADPTGAIAAVLGPFIGFVGALGVFFLGVALGGALAYYGRPNTVPKGP